MSDERAGIARSGHEPDGALLWESAEGQVAHSGTYVLCLAFVWLLVPAVFAMWRYIATSAHTFALTTQRLRESRGVLFRTTQDLELYRVKDISVEQPLLQRLFGRGRIVLVTSDRSSPVIVMNAVADPLAVADLLRDGVERCRVAKGVREFD